jgi:hypothetical protein
MIMDIQTSLIMRIFISEISAGLLGLLGCVRSKKEVGVQ